MGSFNTSCFVSAQTIAPGDLCRVIPILQQSTHRPVSLKLDDKFYEMHGATSSTCYSTAFWKPVIGVFAAEYADYGRVSLKLDSKARVTLLAFFADVLEKCPSVEQGENEYHDLAFDFSDFLQKNAPGVYDALTPKKDHEQGAEKLDRTTDDLDAEMVACWDYVFEVAAKHRLFMRGGMALIRPLQFAIMHEHAYQALVAEAASWERWDNLSCKQDTVLRTALAEARAVSSESERVEPNAWYTAHQFTSTLREVLQRVSNEGSYRSPLESSLLLMFVRKLLDGSLSDDDFIRKFTPFLDDRYAIAGLETFNLKLTPLVYASQDYRNETGKAYVEFVSGISQKICRDRNVRYFGDYLDYSVQVRDPAQWAEVLALAIDSDSPIDGVSTEQSTVDGESMLTVQFSCPRDFEDMKELLAEGFVGHKMVETLVARISA